MFATVNGEEVRVSSITLDTLGWDHAETQGSKSLILNLTESDLLYLGQRLLALAREFDAEEPGYFESEFRTDIPVPRTERLFVDSPKMLEEYIKYPSFWAYETVSALLDRIHGVGQEPEHPLYSIQDFRGLMVNKGQVAIEFGVSTM